MIVEKRIYLSDLMEKEKMKPLLDETGAGLELITFGIGDSLDELEHSIGQEKEKLDYLGNPPLSVHGPFLDLNPTSYDSKIRKVTMDRFNAAYEAAVRLGAEGIVYHSCLDPSNPFNLYWADRSIEFWNEFLEGKSGIKITMENVLDRDPAPFLKVAENIQHPDFGLCLDIGHAHCYSDYTVMDWIRKIGPYIRHLHIHDNDGTRDAHGTLGSGTIPLDQVLPALEALPQEKTWTMEYSAPEQVRESWKYLDPFSECFLCTPGI